MPSEPQPAGPNPAGVNPVGPNPAGPDPTGPAAGSGAPAAHAAPAAPAAGPGGPGGPGGPAGPTRSRWRRRPGRRGLLLGAGALVLLLLAGALGFGAGRHSAFDDDFGFRGFNGGPGHGAMGRGFDDDNDWLGGFGGLGMGPGGMGGMDRRGDDDDFGRGGRGMANTAPLTGSVVSVAPGNLVVAPDGGAAPVTVTTTDRTRVRGGGNGLTGLAPGQRIVVRLAGDRSAAAVLIPEARAVGTITAPAGDRAVLVRTDGLTDVVDLSSVNPKPANGDLVAVTGTATENGATLKVTTLRVLPKAS